MNRIVLVAVTLACAGLARLPAYGEDLVGRPAPPLEIESWIVAPEAETLADLGGRVVLLLLGGAASPDAASSIHRWNDLRAAHWADGLRVIALYSEESEEPAVPVEFSIALGAAPAYGEAGSGPRAVVVAADGEVAWDGAPADLTDEVIAPLLRKTKRFYVKRLTPELKPIVAAFKKGQLARAIELAAGVDHPDVAHVLDRIEALKSYWLACAEASSEAGNAAEAAECLQRLTRHAGVAEAAAKLKTLKADAAAKGEIAAATSYTRLRKELRKAGGKRKKIAVFVKKAEKAATKHQGTRSADRILRLVASVKADPAIEELRTFIAKERIATSGGSWRTRLPKPPQVAFAKGKTYFWNLETSQGSLRLRFLPEVAPMHVSSTIYLTQLGYYDGLTFHRVIPGFMAQGGCPLGSGSGGPGYEYAGEFDPKARHDRAGILSMANAGAGTDGSQFFITFEKAAHLDDKHTVFGVLTDGMDTLRKLEKLGTSSGATKERLLIERATVTVE